MIQADVLESRPLVPERRRIVVRAVNKYSNKEDESVGFTSIVIVWQKEMPAGSTSNDSLSMKSWVSFMVINMISMHVA